MKIELALWEFSDGELQVVNDLLDFAIDHIRRDTGLIKLHAAELNDVYSAKSKIDGRLNGNHKPAASPTLPALATRRASNY